MLRIPQYSRKVVKKEEVGENGKYRASKRLAFQANAKRCLKLTHSKSKNNKNKNVTNINIIIWMLYKVPTSNNSATCELKKINLFFNVKTFCFQSSSGFYFRLFCWIFSAYNCLSSILLRDAFLQGFAFSVSLIFCFFIQSNLISWSRLLNSTTFI